MVDVGIPQNFVDTQDVSLTNVTDSLTYLQLTDVIPDITSTVTKHQLTDDTIDNVFSLRMNSIQGNMVLTTPQLAALVTLTVDVAGVRPLRIWTVAFTGAGGLSTSLVFEAQLKELRPIDDGSDSVRMFFRLEATAVVSVV